jgi:hypothetical protein
MYSLEIYVRGSSYVFDVVISYTAEGCIKKAEEEFSSVLYCWFAPVIMDSPQKIK